MPGVPPDRRRVNGPVGEAGRRSPAAPDREAYPGVDDRRGERWAGAGWALATALSAASLSFPVFERRAPLVSNLDPGQPTAYAVTTFDAWGGSDTVTIGAGLSFQIPGGPNYAVAVLPALVVLMAAAVATAFRGGRRRPALVAALTSVGGPVASGALGAIAVCQLLAYGALLRPSPPGGVYGGGELRPEGELGWGVWLLAAGAVVAVGSALRLLAPRGSGTAAPTAGTGTDPVPLEPLGPAPSVPVDPQPAPAAHPDPAIFRRPGRP